MEMEETDYMGFYATTSLFTSVVILATIVGKTVQLLPFTWNTMWVVLLLEFLIPFTCGFLLALTDCKKKHENKGIY